MKGMKGDSNSRTFRTWSSLLLIKSLVQTAWFELAIIRFRVTLLIHSATLLKYLRYVHFRYININAFFCRFCRPASKSWKTKKKSNFKIEKTCIFGELRKISPTVRDLGPKKGHNWLYTLSDSRWFKVFPASQLGNWYPPQFRNIRGNVTACVPRYV